MTLTEEIRALKRQKNAVILAHTYQPGPVQDAADYVGDSYGLSVEATRTPADVIVFCGVMFMAETAAILNPSRAVLIPAPDAGCPMADMIEPADLVELKNRHPGHIVICYVNSTARIKALSDICCTSSNALKIVRQVSPDRGIIFIPDRHLGSWIEEQTGGKMVLWNGCCPTHARITPAMMRDAKQRHPGAAVLIHPEAPKESRDLADHVLSTGGMCSLVEKDPGTDYIVATETGIIHTLRTRNPSKRFHAVSDRIVCPNMKKTTVELVRDTLRGTAGVKVTIPEETARLAVRSLREMLRLSA